MLWHCTRQAKDTRNLHFDQCRGQDPDLCAGREWMTTYRSHDSWWTHRFLIGLRGSNANALKRGKITRNETSRASNIISEGAVNGKTEQKVIWHWQLGVRDELSLRFSTSTQSGPSPGRSSSHAVGVRRMNDGESCTIKAIHQWMRKWGGHHVIIGLPINRSDLERERKREEHRVLSPSPIGEDSTNYETVCRDGQKRQSQMSHRRESRLLTTLPLF